MSKYWELQSNLEITGSFGLEGTIEVDKKRQLVVGVAKEAIQVTDHKSKESRWFNFLGIGGGISIGKSIIEKFGFSFSDSSFPCKGSYFYAGILNYGEVEMEELVNKYCTVYTGSIGGSASVSGTLFILNPIPVLPFAAAWHSMAWVAGLSIGNGIGGGSLMQYSGILTNSDKK